MKRNLLAIILLSVLLACNHNKQPLPYLGNPVITGSDTLYPTIAGFRLTDQDSQLVTNETFRHRVYVAGFIFLSCPTICPKMTAAMKKVNETFTTDNRVALVSHTIDPERDSIPRLKAYAEALGAGQGKWYFVTGNRDTIHHLAESSYYTTAFPDSTAPGGFTHSGGLLLIDQQKHIRGVYNGTKPEETLRLIRDIKTLLEE